MKKLNISVQLFLFKNIAKVILNLFQNLFQSAGFILLDPETSSG